MHIRLAAIGTRMPAWVVSAVEEYRRRMPAGLQLSVTEVAPVRRSSAVINAAAIAEEGRRLLALVRQDDFAVALDERGTAFSSPEFAAWLKERMRAGRDLVFLIGGADGFASAVLERCELRCSLSRLTFPHALARVLIAEQLYRAHSLLANHPYHRA